MKIAILGIRGLPSSYSGYETIIGELAPRLVQRGHEVTIYCRSALFKDRPKVHKGMQMVYLPSLEHKFFSTLSHTALATVHASFGKHDLIFVVNAANGMFGFIPQLMGKPCILNVNGMEWLRPKWNDLGKFIFKNSARLGTMFYDEIVTDAEEMHRLYARDFGIYSTYIAYGANLEQSTKPELLKDWGLQPKSYYLIATRMIPDNNADLLVEGFVKSGSNRTLVVAGGADYRGNEREMAFLERLKSLANGRVKFIGHVGDSARFRELVCNSLVYLHGHQYGGINPSLLKALGCGCMILALNTPFNVEVLEGEKYGLLFDKTSDALAAKIRELETDMSRTEEFRKRAPERIKERFSWERITDEYEALFRKWSDVP
jgi:glycosyltransferase involved in cell wall biosynthesis